MTRSNDTHPFGPFFGSYQVVGIQDRSLGVDTSEREVPRFVQIESGEDGALRVIEIKANREVFTHEFVTVEPLNSNKRPRIKIKSEYTVGANGEIKYRLEDRFGDRHLLVRECRIKTNDEFVLLTILDRLQTSKESKAFDLTFELSRLY